LCSSESMSNIPRIHTLKELSTLSQHGSGSSLPIHARPSKSYSDKSANELTKSVIAFFELYELADAWRVNNMGVYDAKKKAYRTSASRNGISDICACWCGRLLQIEVKHGKDVISEHQTKHFAKVRKAKGVCFIARTFEQFTFDFWAWIDGKGIAGGAVQMELFQPANEPPMIQTVSWYDFLQETIEDVDGKKGLKECRKYLLPIWERMQKQENEK